MISHPSKKLIICLLMIISFCSQFCDRKASSGTKEYDLVILNGRVIDPESNFDAIRNVGIKEGSSTPRVWW